MNSFSKNVARNLAGFVAFASIAAGSVFAAGPASAQDYDCPAKTICGFIYDTVADENGMYSPVAGVQVNLGWRDNPIAGSTERLPRPDGSGSYQVPRTDENGYYEIVIPDDVFAEGGWFYLTYIAYFHGGPSVNQIFLAGDDDDAFQFLNTLRTSTYLNDGSFSQDRFDLFVDFD